MELGPVGVKQCHTSSKSQRPPPDIGAFLCKIYCSTYYYRGSKKLIQLLRKMTNYDFRRFCHHGVVYKKPEHKIKVSKTTLPHVCINIKSVDLPPEAATQH